MHELRLVFIIVGVLAIAAVLFHGFWTSKKGEKSKFAEKPVGSSVKLDALVASTERLKIAKKEKNKSVFGGDRILSHDPLGVDDPLDEDAELEQKTVLVKELAAIENEEKSEIIEGTVENIVEKQNQEEEPKVIVLHVHCAGDEAFSGTKLFESMQQNGLLYGAMDIFHRHNDMSGTGQVLFSVANMMQPGTLRHDDPAAFSTKGISFFMTLPCFGEAEQNFKMMLKTAQQIADDLGANVLDEQRNLMTPDKLASYRNDIRDFESRSTHEKD